MERRSAFGPLRFPVGGFGMFGLMLLFFTINEAFSFSTLNSLRDALAIV
jgi:hypothetical protein